MDIPPTKQPRSDAPPVGLAPPLRFFMIAILVIFVAELAIMKVLDFFHHLHPRHAAFIDAIMLGGVVLPLLYYFSYKPLRNTVHLCEASQKKIAGQNAFLRTVLDALPYPFYVIDAESYQVKIANQAAGVKEGDNPTCYAISHQYDAPCPGGEHPCPLAEVKRTRVPVTLEHVHYDQQGNRRLVEVHGYPVFDANGDLVQMIESSLDITQRRMAEDALRKSEKSLQDFLDNANDLILILDPDGGFLYANQAFQAALGYTANEIMEMAFYDILNASSIASWREMTDNLTTGPRRGGDELVFVAKNGAMITVEANFTARIEEDAPIALRGICRDITRRKRLEAQLLEQQQLTEKMIKFSAVPIFVLNKEHIVTNWNKACEKMTGIVAQQVVGTNEHWRAFYPHPRACLADLVIDGAYDTLPRFYDAFDTSTFLHDGIHSEGWFDSVGGERRYLTFDAVPIYNRTKEELVAVIETLQDISERKRLEEQLEYQARTDQLTGLLNRRRFEELLYQEVERARRYHTPLSLVMFDLDYFKNVNDNFGHMAGDQTLRQLAGIIRKNTRGSDQAGRWGGEEFMLLCPGTPAREAVLLGEKIRTLVESHSFGLVGTITISCGATGFLEQDAVDSFIKRADDALYTAKERGRNMVVLG